MNLLITGANGFMGKNLIATLEQAPHVDHLYRIDVDSTEAELALAAQNADFVFHLAGVNRPKEEIEFQQGNADFTQSLLTLLEAGRKPPVLMSGSTQAALDNPYGRSKRQAELSLLSYGERTGSPVYLYRLTNAFGKWSRPRYNSAVATFCYQIARGLPVTVSDPAKMLRLVYIDDIVDEFLRALAGCPRYGDDGFCHAEPEHEIALGALVETLEKFQNNRTTLDLPDQSDPLTHKLYATFLSFLPPDGFAVHPPMNSTGCGSDTEVLRMGGYGRIGVTVLKPHALLGNHWHHTRQQKITVLRGRGVIHFRSFWDRTVIDYPVSGEVPTVVDIPPGYAHQIENRGETDLVALQWSSVGDESDHPDTFPLPTDVGEMNHRSES